MLYYLDKDNVLGQLFDNYSHLKIMIYMMLKYCVLTLHKNVVDTIMITDYHCYTIIHVYLPLSRKLMYYFEISNELINSHHKPNLEDMR